ncbi:MAG: Phosphoserine phosphatase 1 [Firmicutes bacterium]|nr:Phosphoserine phosphatase 1 [Bacillota bacterium]
MLTVLLVRHGETDHNKNNIMQGHLDVPLNDTGRAQAKHLARHLASRYRIEHIYSSPLLRAFSTAEIIAAKQQCPITAAAELRELDVGLWQGLTLDEGRLSHPTVWEKLHADTLYTRRPSGESYWDLYQRTTTWLASILPHHSLGTICLVTHGGCVRTLLAHALSAPPELFSFASALTVDNTGLTVLQYKPTPRRWQVRTVNATCHLQLIEV